MTTELLAPVYRRSGEREVKYLTGTMNMLVTSEDTNGAFAVVEFQGKPGGEPPMHVHENEDEMFYIVEGKVEITVGGQKQMATAGSAAFLPRRIPHTFRIVSPEARAIVYITPGGFENYFRQVSELVKGEAPTPEQQKLMAQLCGEYGVQFLVSAAAN